MEDIEYESSVSSNLSFLNEEVDNQKVKNPKKSNNNSPQKISTSSKLQKESKEKNSKQESIEEEPQPETAEKEKAAQPQQPPKQPESKAQEKQQQQPEAIEPEVSKKKEETTEMEQEEDEQPAEEHEEADEPNGEDDANNNNKESEEENDNDKEEEDQDDEEEEQKENGNNTKEGKENEKESTNQNSKKKGQQQASNATSKKVQLNKKQGSANSSTPNSSNNKQSNNSSAAPAKSNTAKQAQTVTKGSSESAASSQLQKLNQKRPQRVLNEEATTPSTQGSSATTPGSAQSNGNSITTNSTAASSSHAATNNVSSSQPVKPTKKLSSKFYLYKEGVKLPDLSDQLNQTIEVRVSKEYIHRFNKQYLSRSIWGSDNYTSDSDIVCILIHHGLVKFESPELQKDSKYAGVQVTFTVSKGRKTYQSQEKNSITSRQSKTHQGSTIKPNQCNFITTLGSQEDLNRNAALMCTPLGRKKIKPNHVLQSRNILSIPESNIMFNLSNDPAYKYSIINFCDKGEESKDWMSHRLQQYALYIENDQDRYEISRVPEGDMNLVNEFDSYKIARVKNPYSTDNEEMLKQPIPLPQAAAELLFTDLDWSDFKWGSNAVCIKDKEISNLKCYKLYLKNQVD